MRQIDAVRNESKEFDAALEKARTKLAQGEVEAVPPEAVTESALDQAAEAARSEAPARAVRGPDHADLGMAVEAIILEELRPAWFVKNDAIEVGGNYDRTDLVQGNLAMLSEAARKVGRVDLLFHPQLDYAGTGWMVAPDIAVTNRHVAEVFADRDSFGRWRFAQGTSDSLIESRLDFLRQHDQDDSARRRVEVTEILYIARPGEPDFAFLRVTPPSGLDPLEFADAAPEPGEPIAAIGYPAWDGRRNDPALMDRLFGGIYGVKRFSPGLARASSRTNVFEADYTSLGGNSGSAVISLATGKAVGLHFAGLFRDTNYAVAAPIVQAALRDLQTRIAVPQEAPQRDPKSSPQKLTGRTGYDPAFLGSDHAVPWPSFGPWEADRAPLLEGEGHELRYTHFSVVQSASRRLPLVTAVNIDGEKAFNLKRKGTWRLDGRIAEEHQIGNDLYRDNPIDRGHLVRRMDPGWGDTREEAQEGETDSFHYTNSAPQHENLNQKEWLELEDYILQSTSTRGFRACVMTGPVFRSDDKKLRAQAGAGDIGIPREFWKVAAMINDDTGRLSVTGYVLSQGEMIKSLTEAAFVFGEFKTYQVRLALIEQATGLDFGALKDFDPLASNAEAVFGAAAVPLSGPESLRL